MGRRWGARGEQSPRAKLTEKKVREIKRMLRDGVQGKVIAAQYGIAPSMVTRIKSGLSWGEVQAND